MGAAPTSPPTHTPGLGGALASPSSPPHPRLSRDPAVWKQGVPFLLILQRRLRHRGPRQLDGTQQASGVTPGGGSSIQGAGEGGAIISPTAARGAQ